MSHYYLSCLNSSSSHPLTSHPEAAPNSDEKQHLFYLHNILLERTKRSSIETREVQSGVPMRHLSPAPCGGCSAPGSVARQPPARTHHIQGVPHTVYRVFHTHRTQCAAGPSDVTPWGHCTYWRWWVAHMSLLEPYIALVRLMDGNEMVLAIH